VIRALRCLCLAAALASAPAAVGAQAIVDSITVAYDLDGLRILHHKTNNPTFAIRLHLLGGSRQLTRDNAGIEALYLIASDYGTTEYPGVSARRARARSGSQIDVAVGADWSVFTGDGLREEFDSTFMLMASRLMHPSLDSTAMTIARNQLLMIARSALNSPEAQSSVLAESIAFLNHPYSVNPMGNETSLRALTADDLRRYATEQFVKSRMLLVVVGDVSKEHLDALVGRTLATLPRGSYTWTLPEPVRATAPAFAPANRRISTNYIFGYMHGPAVNGPDYPAFEYAMGILSSWVSGTIREVAGLSYAAGVTTFDRGSSGAAFYMSTPRPDSAMKLVNRVMDVLEEEVRYSNYGLRQAASGMRDSYLFGMQSAGSHASLLARSLLYDGDHRAAGRRADVMRQVSFTDIRRMWRTYVKNIQWGYVGDTIAMPREQMGKRR
jgi:zinc protease